MEKEKLIELLNRYINEYDNLKEESSKCHTLKELYEELLNNFNGDYQMIIDNKLNISFLITALYKDDIYLNEFYNSLINIKESEESRVRFRKLVKIFNYDYQNNIKNLDELNIRIFRNRFLYQSAKRVIICLSHNIPINGNKYDILNIKKILNYYETIGTLNNKEELLLLNELELHNRKVLSDDRQEKKEQIYVETLYDEIPNILNAGYQKHDVIEVSEERKPILDKFVKEIKTFIYEIPKEGIIENIEAYSNYNILDTEFNYILVKILDDLQDSLITFYELLIEKEIYTNMHERIEAIKSYYNALDRYITISKYYDSINTYEEDDIDTQTISKENKPKEVKTVIYSHSPNSSKARIISDMKDIPHEYYTQVTDLIDRFKSDDLQKGEIKQLQNNRHLDKLTELKNDQIRITLRHIKGNLYCIMGVATKKDNNDMHMYNTMANRLMPLVNTDESLKKELEFAKIVETELASIVKEKGRKGNR